MINKRKQTTPAGSSDFVILGILCGIVSLHFIGGLFPGYYTWGFSYWNMFSNAMQFTFYATALICLVLLFLLREKIANLTLLSTDSIQNRSSKVIFVSLVSVALFIIFYLFRSQAHIYGDGFTILDYVSKKEPIVIKDQFYLQIGSVYLHHYLYKIVTQFSKLSAEEIFAVTNAVGGVIGVWAMYAIASLLGENKIQKLFYLITMLTSGVVILFFGYIENYVWATSISLWALFFIIEYSQGKSSPVTMFLFSLLALLFHAITLPFLVLSVFVLLDNSNNTAFSNIKMRTFVIIVATVSVTVVILAHFQGRTLFVPLITTEINNYSLLYPKHISDLLNLTLLLSPLGLFVIVFSIFSNKEIAQEPVYRALALLVVITFMAVVVIDPEIGMARDFDLFAIIAVPFSVFAGFLLIRKHQVKIQNWMVIGLVILFASHVLPNLYEKNSLERAVEHLDAVIWDDPHYQPEYNRALRGLSWGFLLRKSVNRPDLAKKYFERNAESDTLNSSPLYNLALVFIDGNQLDSARYYLKQGYLTTPHDPKYFAKLAELENNQKLYFLGEQYSGEALKIDPNFLPALTTMGISLSSQGKEAGYEYLSKAYQLKPNSFEHTVNLGIYFLQFLNVDSAYVYFSQALEYVPKEQKEALLGSLISLAHRKNLTTEAHRYYNNLIDEYPNSNLIPQKKQELGL